MSTANYDAACWAENKTDAEIMEKIEEIRSYWKRGRGFQFPGSAHYQYQKELALAEILEQRKNKGGTHETR